MNLSVPSRFAVLRIEGDNEPRQKKNVDGQKKNVDGQKKNTKQDAGKANQNTQGTKKKNKPAAQKKKPPTEAQWAEWQKKDAELADGNYEVDLHQAILLSKVDFEKNKDLYEQRKKAAAQEKKALEEKKVPNKKTKKATVKPQPMSLDQFKNFGAETKDIKTDLVGQQNLASVACNGFDNDPEFFERIKDDTKEALNREHKLALRKAREPDILKAITQAQYQDTLDKKDKQISSLNEEVKKLKEDLHNVKTRNKKLCQILANGEMKDKAQLLVELDKMHRVKDELSSEVSSLHVQLEQERSKNHALTTDPKNKAQGGKKRVTSQSEAAQQ